MSYCYLRDAPMDRGLGGRPPAMPGVDEIRANAMIQTTSYTTTNKQQEEPGVMQQCASPILLSNNPQLHSRIHQSIWHLINHMLRQRLSSLSNEYYIDMYYMHRLGLLHSTRSVQKHCTFSCSLRIMLLLLLLLLLLLSRGNQLWFFLLAIYGSSCMNSLMCDAFMAHKVAQVVRYCIPVFPQTVQ